jgi:hypothetical protein
MDYISTQVLLKTNQDGKPLIMLGKDVLRLPALMLGARPMPDNQVSLWDHNWSIDINLKAVLFPFRNIASCHGMRMLVRFS